MLMPKRTKYRKMMRGRMTGKANRGVGDFLRGVRPASHGAGLGEQSSDRSPRAARSPTT